MTDGVLAGLDRIVAESASLEPVLVVGAPIRAGHGLFNTAVVIHRGRVLGVVPKTYLPEYHEFYEKRHFRSARDAVQDELQLLGETVPFGSRLVFACTDVPGFAVHVEICEDLWAPIPPEPRRAGRRDGARQPLGQQRHDRQGRLPAPAVRLPVCEDNRRYRCSPRPGSASRPPTWRGTDRR